ncbi:salt-induced outer membrane protein [Alcanivorax xiamenensis]|uniref:Salt-induced outer membrane protein n=2 Tax=Alcanivoracaceae TaxID=224372 RepID=A0ABQ6Y9W5_9GAMM|nr:salt-induced outer membrane protein [Alcanivorax xiamenensis]
MMRKQCLVLACALAAGPALSYAQEAEETAKPRGWDIELEGSYLLKSGNTRSQNLAAVANLTHDGRLWRHTGKMEAVNEMSRNDETREDERTAERYYGSYKLDRKFGYEGRNYIFNIVTYDKDNFSGYHYQASYAVGLGRRFLDTETHTLDLEAGPGYRVDCLDPSDSYTSCQDKEESLIGRFAAKYEWKISETASFKEDFTTEVGDENTVVRAETSLTSKINDHFSLRLSHLLKRNSKVPDDGSHRSDQETRVSVVYTF